MAEVTKDDREAAQALCASGWTHAIDAFARHREASTEALRKRLYECEQLLLHFEAWSHNQPHPIEWRNRFTAYFDQSRAALENRDDHG